MKLSCETVSLLLLKVTIYVHTSAILWLLWNIATGWDCIWEQNKRVITHVYALRVGQHTELTVVSTNDKMFIATHKQIYDQSA